MCGIAGIVRTDGAAVDVSLVAQMTALLRHRGPDDEGYLLGMFPEGAAEPAVGADTVAALRATHLQLAAAAGPPYSLAFGHRRLSIIDCTPGGHQPMAGGNETLWVVYNGEIYNHIELRAELETKGHVFRTRSDTEVLLAAYAEWGPECLQHFNGMWAFCLWDRRRGQLFCARDRFGVKPFYYHYDGIRFVFASEIKALLAVTGSLPVNDEMAYDYLRLSFLDHTPATMIAGIHQLAPGHWLGLDGNGQVAVQRYYTLAYSTEQRSCDEARLEQLGATYRDRLTDAVRLRLRTDVPLGSCLSGGLDSSSIVCAMSRLLAGSNAGAAPQLTFTAAYDDPLCDERRFAQQVTAATGAVAHYTFPRSEELWDDLVALTWHQDEPFGSTSIYAQWCVMRAARRAGVTVMLDGQGGDELLAGYTGYYAIWLKELLRRGYLGQYWNELRASAQRAGRSPFRLAAKTSAVTYEPLRNLMPQRARGLAVLEADFASRHRHRRAMWHKVRPAADLQARLWADHVQFSLPQLLHYEDRNSMAFSIEARVPFVDVHLVEWVFQQPPSVKLHAGWSKYLARKGVVGLCPEAIVWRTDKVGFKTPEATWMASGRDVFHALCEPSTFRAGRFIDALKLRGELFPDGGRVVRWRRELWGAINFELWMRTFGVT